MICNSFKLETSWHVMILHVSQYPHLVNNSSNTVIKELGGTVCYNKNRFVGELQNRCSIKW